MPVATRLQTLDEMLDFWQAVNHTWVSWSGNKGLSAEPEVLIWTHCLTFMNAASGR
jgi:hypothetical protein